MRKAIALTALALLAGASLAEDLPDGVGVDSPSGSVFTTEITASDSDDYVFRGYPGMVLTASVKAAKGTKTVPNLLVPAIEVLRPGGALVSDDEGLSVTTTQTTASAKLTLDATGYWKVRVRGSGGTAGAYSVAVKYGKPVLAALPLASKSFKAAGRIASGVDADDFPFQGYAGQSFAATLTVPKTSALDPLVTLIRPDGSSAATAAPNSKGTAFTITTPLDADGTWRIHVLGKEADPEPPHNDATTGDYTLSVKLGKAASTGIALDANKQYHLTLPGVGGATLGWKLSFSGSAPVFNSLVDPNGKTVPGVLLPGTDVKGLKLDPSLPIGDYVLTFDAPPGAPPTSVGFTRSLALPRSAPKRVAKLSKVEPLMFVDSPSPTAGAASTKITVHVNDIIDPNAPTGSPTMFIGHVPLQEVTPLNATTYRGTVPVVPQGTFHVVVFSSSGQPVARANSFQIVPPPQVVNIDPSVGPDSGGFEVTITGSNFRPGRMGVLLDGFPQPVTPTYSDETRIVFTAPPRPAGSVVYGVQDLDTQLTANLPRVKPNLEYTFEYVATASISRLVPSLIPILGNELVSIQGANFAANDMVFIETAPGSGTYDRILTPTFVNSKKHQFTAPPRPKGQYRVHVQNSLGQPNPPKTRVLSYYSFADFTAATNLGGIGDPNDAWTTAIADYDKNGTQDLFLSRRGTPTATTPESESLTRVLRNDGNGQFTEVTTSLLPPVVNDDWRADQIWVSDVNTDGYPDILITTNAKLVPAEAASHTRILMNEPRTTDPTNRVFRDRTSDKIMAPRTMQHYGAFGYDNSVYIADNWRGLDMWVGDIDKGASGPPEIVITHDELKDDSNNQTDVFASGVYCGNYCVAAQTFAYSYSFYWGGSRLFVWDKTAKSGQGQYKFDPNFFPRKSGPVVPQWLPGGGTIPGCSPHYSSICHQVFTPFTGKKLAVGTIDGDTKPDVAVLSDKVVQRRAKVNDPLQDTSSLQIGINKFNPADGAGVTDITDTLKSMPGDTKGDALAIGQPGFPDGNSYGVVAISKASASGGQSVLRLFRFVPGVGAGSFTEISSGALPPVDPNDRFQASALQFLDIDQDGDQDLALLANAGPSVGQSAFRIFRNERVGNTVGNFARTLDPLFAGMVTATEHFDGEVLTIGDVSGDGLLDYVISRPTSAGAGTQTRIVKTDR